MQKKFLFILCTNILFFMCLFGKIPTLSHHLKPNDITITTLGRSGTTIVRSLNPYAFEKYKNTTVQPYHPEREGGFATVPSIVNSSWSFPVHFKASETDTIKQKPLSQRAIVLTLPGLGGRAFDTGPFATALRSCADIMVIGTVADRYPDQQDKPINNFKEGSLTAYIADKRTKQFGGALQRTVNEPIEDIIKLLRDGVTVTYPDGSTHHIRPYDYGTIIAVGFCISNATFIKIQEKLINNNLRGFDGFIMDSPLADFQSPIPANWARKPAGFGPPCLILPSLEHLKNKGKAVPAYILHGGHDELCTLASVISVLKTSHPSSSMIVSTLPAGHARCMYNDTSDKNNPDKRPWQKIPGSRQVHSGLMQEWFKVNFG